MNAEKQIRSLLAEYGAVLKRDRKHQVWELPGGKKFTVGQNKVRVADLHQLRRMLGLNSGGQAGERRERRHRTQIPKPTRRALATLDFSGQLYILKLEAEIDRLELEMDYHEDEIARLTEIIDSAVCSCRWCRFKRWVRERATLRHE